MPLQIRVANDIWSDFRIFQKRKQAQCMYPLTSLLTGTHGSVVAWSAEGCHRLCWEFPDQRGEKWENNPAKGKKHGNSNMI